MSANAAAVLTRLAGHLQTGVRTASRQWDTPSACPGWTNADILVHLSCTLRELAAPQTLPPPVPGDIEATNEVQVVAFRAGAPASAMSDYAEQLPGALAVLEQMQSSALAGTTFSLENAGVYPVHLAADSLVFDHYCHLRHDVTVGSHVLLPLTEDLERSALHWSVRWLMAGLPQMSRPELADVVTSPVALQLGGPSGGAWTIRPAPNGTRLVLVSPGTDADTILRSSADDFVRWGTGREPWRAAGITVEGDQKLAAATLDAIHVF